MTEPHRSDIAWEDARAANLRNWNDRAELHVDSYGIHAYDDPAHISSVIRDDLAALRPFLPDGVCGLDVCHLQCHIGTDTVSLARSGARVTGVDFSPAALEAAADLARRARADVAWVESDVLAAREAVEGDFDLVYTSIGTICWLQDLDRWARQIHDLLRPGALFYIRDGHPMLYALDEDADELRLRLPYFGDGRAQAWDDPGTYVGEGTVEHARSYEWPHPISEILGALLGAGLRLEAFGEGTTLPWRFSKLMTEQPDGSYAYPDELRPRVPTTFTVVARRP